MHGLIESMRTPFAQALAPFKGGRSGRAEILRAPTYVSTGEFVNVHYEPTIAQDTGIHSFSESGGPAYTLYLDGRLATPLKTGDKLKVRGITLEVEFGAFPANVGPVDSVPAVLRGEPRL
jgi:hypothetical protein